jgi:DNA polymerase III sliding clamp (beta) subunit (PCNA family)
MTMSLKQTDLFRFERLMSRLMKSSVTPMVHFTPNGSSIKLLASTDDAMLTMSAPRDGFLVPFSMQWTDFKTFAIKKDKDVDFDLEKNAVVVRSEGISQRFLTGKNASKTPLGQPSQTSTFPKERLLDALSNAGRCVDKDSIRTALGGICLRGSTSQIVSTTGAQLLAQDGYDFCFCESNDVVIPMSKIYASKELKDVDADDIELGLIKDHIYFGLGYVEFWLHTIDGTFPKVDQLLKPADGTTYLNFHPTDVQFLLDKIEKLPGAKDNESPLYLLINKAIQARAHDTNHKTGIALELSHSQYTGEPVDVAMNRHFLKNALQFGCLRMGIDPTGDKAVIFKGDDKTFVCMPLTSTEPVATHIDVITASTQTTVASVAPKTSAVTPAPVRRRRRAVKRDTAVQPTSKTALIQTVEQLRNDLRSSLIQTNSVLRELKSQKQKDKLLHSTMESLRKLSLA